DGMQVTVRARVSLYENRGEFQLIVEHAALAGDGALQRAFEALKNRLHAEGLFDPAHRQVLPKLPARAGVITSPSGAAVRDVLSVLRRRFPGIPVLIYPVPVQGRDAPAAIIKALETANRRKDCDVLLLARGGGSLEDLQAFNDEGVARAVYASAIPIVSGIGHEIDFTIVDFVADLRAATPSAAAESISPDGQAWRHSQERLQQRLQQRMRQILSEKRSVLENLAKRLQHPRQQLQSLNQRLDELELRLGQAMRLNLNRHTQRLAALDMRLRHQDPRQSLAALDMRRAHLEKRLAYAWLQQLQARRAKLAALGRALDAMNPLATLQRGYAIVTDPAAGNNKVLQNAGAVSPGKQIHARLAHGTLLCTVEKSIEE
ncbi:MAG: exodeoxyribonuclease VII large subunit, partial [Gammaproteobacteria bacterium]|nr:exodeoxyribonuclease VII large subunit [Gammaproteobacteria bacterium]